MGFFDNIGFSSVLPIVGNLIDAGIGHYESNRQMHFQEDMMKDQMAWQEKMNAQQQEWQEGMWNKTNEYNTPSASIQRLIDAGVNPNNAAQMIAGGNNQAQMAQQPQTPSAPSGLPGSKPNPTNFAQGLKDAALMDSAIDLNKAQAENQRDQGEAALRNAGVQEKKVELDRKQVDAIVTNLDKQNQLIEKNIEIADEEKLEKKLRNEYQRIYNEEILPLVREGKVQEIENLKAEYKEKLQAIQESKARVQELKSKIALNAQLVKESKAREGNIMADTELKQAQKGVVEAEKKIKEAEAAIESIYKDLAERLGYDPRDYSDLWKQPSAFALMFMNGAEKVINGAVQQCDDAVNQISKYGKSFIESAGSRVSWGVNGSTVNPRLDY